MMKEQKFNSKKFAVTLIILLVIIVSAIYFFIIKNYQIFNNNESIQSVETEQKPVQSTEKKYASKNEYALTDNNLSKFDLSFLKFENEKKNKIYSPLSIKYAFKMLEEGTTGDAKEQLSSIVGGYNLTKYKTNKEMAFANAFFINSKDEEKVKADYIELLKRNYDADIKFDDFASADNINNWVNENTLGLIDKLFEDDDVADLEFALINALGIDMEWEHKFLVYDYADDSNITFAVEYKHQNVYWATFEELYNLKFDNDQDVSSMYVVATLNNYDIVKDLGEEKIKEVVKEDFTKWAKEKDFDNVAGDAEAYFDNDFSDEGIERAFEKYWSEGNYSYEGNYQGYLDEIKENYGKVDYSTDFSIYTDDNVKVFSKDLKESDGTTLQYIGIMPTKEDLDSYVQKTSETEIKDLIGKLKDLKLENFKDGVLTKITGYIPKFNFDYELNLKQDLNKLGVTDIFEQGKANLTNLTNNDEAYIGEVKHKATIEFTENGIKAAAATGAGGMGGGDFYDYIFDIPTEEIDITFDKPYMFLIRDKDTGETWFVGTVYEPLAAEDEKGPVADIVND